MNIQKQIELGLLVCPQSGKKLFFLENHEYLKSRNSKKRYRLFNKKIPVLLIDPEWAKKYADDSQKMNQAYNPSSMRKGPSFFHRMIAGLKQDYRTESSKKAYSVVFQEFSENKLCLSIGGGPMRLHPQLTNLNIGPFPNVDIVSDAHHLPYRTSSVDAIHCEAVLEHLYDPAQAIREMYRVLIPGKKAFLCTPFMQSYHGYPHHYQNFTLTGQSRLAESAGFRVLEAGPCVGPLYVMFDLATVFLNEYVPRPVNIPLRKMVGALSLCIRPLDKIIGLKANAHVLASTTYVLVEKPGAKSTR
jgi:uncharacterized protein YbaR (Trm112 family)